MLDAYGLFPLLMPNLHDIMCRLHIKSLEYYLPPEALLRAEMAEKPVMVLQHYAQPSAAEAGHDDRAAAIRGDQLGVTFTATPSASGSLLLGSSREFGGWDTSPCPNTVQAILSHAEQYLPRLGRSPGMDALHSAGSRSGLDPSEPRPDGSGLQEADEEGPLRRGGSAVQTAETLAEGLLARVGLRPYVTGGVPLIGPLPGFPHVVVAAGHEGSGLTLGPATAELVMRHIAAGKSERGPSELCSGAAGLSSIDAAKFYPAQAICSKATTL